jgi:quercetin dioxygenase-like cupin family protein
MTDDFDPIANMERIRAFTNRDDAVPLHNISHISKNTAVIDCIQGSCEAINLLDRQHIELGVVKATLTANTIVCNHTHKELEILNVIEGEMFQDIEGVITSAKVGEYIIALPNIQHKHYCIVPTIIIAVSIPASRGYPNG